MLFTFNLDVKKISQIINFSVGWWLLKKLKIKSLDEVSRWYILLFGTYKSKERKILYYLLKVLEVLVLPSIDFIIFS